MLRSLSLCLNATSFVFRGVFYQQVFETAMGSPVSVVMANMIMEDIEAEHWPSFQDFENSMLMTYVV